LAPGWQRGAARAVFQHALQRGDLVAGDGGAGGGAGQFPAMLAVPSLTAGQHLQLLLKPAIVASSWLCSYFAVKHLPVSIAAPIRAMGPVWTLLGALVLLRERPSLLETFGVSLTLISFVGLSFAGHKEGIHFHRDKWIGWLLAGTLLNAVSALLFREANIRQELPAVMGVLLGIVLTILG
jgi:transporter family protein